MSDKKAVVQAMEVAAEFAARATGRLQGMLARRKLSQSELDTARLELQKALAAISVTNNVNN